MTPDDAPASSRRARGAESGAIPTDAAAESSDGVLTLEPDEVAPGTATGSLAVTGTGPTGDDSSTTPLGELGAAHDTAPAPASEAPADGRPIALGWVDEDAVARPPAATDFSTASIAYIPVGPDLLANAPRRSPLRAGVIAPTLIVAGLIGAYAATTLMWPLHAVTPTIAAVEVQPVAAPAAEMRWPKAGSAAVAVEGIPGPLTSTGDARAIASITKVVTALLVLDQMPLAPGEPGPEFRFTYADSLAYWGYLNRGESALDVPVDGALSQYQMLEGMLVGSANNYADRLAGNLYASDEVFADAAMEWLTTHGVDGVTIVEPTGMDSRNAASPEALLVLAKKALANPVIAEIVAKRSVDLPGAGKVENTNALLADAGVVGIKTGTLDAWNLLSAKDITIGETPVRLYAAVLGQPDDKARIKVSRSMYKQLEAQLQLSPSVGAGTLAGTVDTDWGEQVDIVTEEDASVVLWNGGAGEVTTTYALGDSRESGDTVGSLSVQGPLDSASVDLRLTDDIEGPTAWWRLTHPLELFGLAD